MIRARLARFRAFIRECGWRLDYLGYRRRIVAMRAARICLPWPMRFKILVGLASKSEIVWAAEDASDRQPKVRTLATKTQAGASIIEWRRRSGVLRAKTTG